MFDFGARWVFAKKVVALPVLRRSNWSGNKAATAILADIAQNIIHTCGTERTLISADARIE